MILLAAVALASRAAAQQPGSAGATRPNLKVLQALPEAQLFSMMNLVAESLGVRCDYCHVPEARDAAAAGPAGGPERLDFASDDRVTKRTARFMLRMVDSLNGVVLAALPQRHDPPVRMDCVTCHRGSPLPQTLDVVLAQTVERQGVDSAVARYRQLRQDVVAGRYDFGELTVNDVARRLTAAGKPAEAIALLQMNQEFYPNSAAIDLLFADAHLARGERDAAIARVRTALVKQPNNQQAQRRLAQLTAP